VRAGIVALTLVIAGCSATPPTVPPTSTGQSPSGQPTTSGGPSPTALATATGEPLPTDDPGPPDDLPEITADQLNPPRPPLPEPVIDDLDQINEAMFTPGREEQAIVSMLKAVGFGLYHDDGTVIRLGTETSAEDFSLSESQAYGLVAMLRQQSDGETWMSFREFHDQLVEFGLEATPEELLAAFQTAYARDPDAPMTRIVQSQAFLELDAEIPPLGTWLLFVDGMIPPHGEGQAMALAGGGFPTVAQARPRAGIAFRDVERLLNRPDVRRSRDAAHIRAAMEGASLTVTGPSFVHEGHNAPGQPATFTATVNSRSLLGTSNLCQGGSLSGVSVAWDFDAALSSHGSTSVANFGGGVTDGSGRTTFTFTPKQEDMKDGPTRGRQVREVAHLTASVNPTNLARAMCPGIPVIGRPAPIALPHQVAVGWHVPKSMTLTIENTYGIIFNNSLGGGTNLSGEDSFIGRLVEKEDETWEGTFVALTQSSGSGVFWAHDPACPLEFSGLQILTVFGEKRPSRLPGEPFGTTNGDFVLEFFPAAPAEAVVGTQDCPSARRPGSRYDYLPFNDAAIWDTNVGLAMKFPTRHIDVQIYPLVSEQSNVTFVRETEWTFTIDLDEDE
jgi:hypothetical protein